MNTQKIAITIPKDLIVIVDETSRLKGYREASSYREYSVKKYGMKKIAN
jgi:metal-responsive CopG/Arc/MetJ family transcriptional regulator